MWQIGGRYERDIIYTYVGTILVSINPFKYLKKYLNKLKIFLK